MPRSLVGLLVGLLLAIAAAVGGFGAFLLAVVLGAVGWGIGAQLEGRLDLSEVVPGRGRG